MVEEAVTPSPGRNAPAAKAAAPSPGATLLSLLMPIVRVVTSLRLVVVLLSASLALVFLGTLAQVHEGLWAAQAKYFKSWLVTRPTVGNAQWPIVIPGGYLLGTLLLVNLAGAFIKRFQFTKKKIGIHLIHVGLVCLLLGQLLTDMLSTESAMRMAEGTTRNYSEDFRANELAVVDTSDPAHDTVVAIPETTLGRAREIRHKDLPFTLRVQQHWHNSVLRETPGAGAVPAAATQGADRGLHVMPLPTTVKENERNMPSAVIEVVNAQGKPEGSWLVSTYLGTPQAFTVNGRNYQMSLRFTRYYKPFDLRLISFTHEKYAGTQIPSKFASRVRVVRPATGENREVEISMNEPLRYEGETYYQAGFDENNDNLVNKITIFQVVRNPGWITPYAACSIMTLGLLVQFGYHLFAFTRKLKKN
jgi:hypothetical protein